MLLGQQGGLGGLPVAHNVNRALIGRATQGLLEEPLSVPQPVCHTPPYSSLRSPVLSQLTGQSGTSNSTLGDRRPTLPFSGP